MMNREERERFTVDAFGFLSKLAHLGIISEDQREALVEKALTTFADRIELGHVKYLVASAFFTSPQDRENNPSDTLRRIKDTAWN